MRGRGSFHRRKGGAFTRGGRALDQPFRNEHQKYRPFYSRERRALRGKKWLSSPIDEEHSILPTLYYLGFPNASMKLTQVCLKGRCSSRWRVCDVSVDHGAALQTG